MGAEETERNDPRSMMSANSMLPVEVVARVKRGKVSLRVAADLTGPSGRFHDRFHDRFKKRGAAGMIHQLRR